MIALEFDGVNAWPGKPKNWDEEKDGTCFALPIRYELDPMMQCTSVWAPTPEERRRIAAGENIVLNVVGRQPPVMLSVAAIHGSPAAGQNVRDEDVLPAPKESWVPAMIVVAGGVFAALAFHYFGLI